MTYRNWTDLAAPDYAAFGPQTIALQPLAATVPASAHLPLLPDTHLTASVLDRALPLLKRDMDVVVLPALGCTSDPASSDMPGVLTVSSPAYLALMTGIMASVARTGVRRMVFLHGRDRNTDLLDKAVLQARTEHNMRAAHVDWWASARVDSVANPETSAMLAARPDLVHLENDVSLQAATVEEGAKVLNAAASRLARYLAAFARCDLPEST